MSVCYRSQVNPEQQLQLNYAGVDLISWTFEALHLPVTPGMFEGASPRIKYDAQANDCVRWAKFLEEAITEEVVTLRDCYSEHRDLCAMTFEEYLEWLGSWVSFLRESGGYTTT